MTRIGSEHRLPTLSEVLGRVHRRVVVAAVVLAAISCTLAGAMVIRDYESRNLKLTANSIAYTVEPALVFGDLDAAGDGISEVVDARIVSKVRLVDPDGAEIGQWEFERSGLARFAGRIADPIFWPSPLRAKVSRNGEDLGTVYVFGSSAMLLTYFVVGLIFAVGCMALAVVTTHMLAKRLQSDVIGPLEQIAQTAHAVRHHRTFSRRIPGSGIEEIDRFSQDFNALIAELQERHDVIVLENRKLAKKAALDPLTGLGNRASFESYLERVLSECDQLGSGVAVAFLDVDKFKPINDIFGHDAGDVVLQKIGSYLRSIKAPGYRAFRIGGDEFALVVEDSRDKKFIEYALNELDRSFLYGAKLPSGNRVPIFMSMGAAIYPEDGRTSSELLKHADTEMYKQKRLRSRPEERQRSYA